MLRRKKLSGGGWLDEVFRKLKHKRERMASLDFLQQPSKTESLSLAEEIALAWPV